jgi:hypothetical protein
MVLDRNTRTIQQLPVLGSRLTVVSGKAGSAINYLSAVAVAEADQLSTLSVPPATQPLLRAACPAPFRKLLRIHGAPLWLCHEYST